MSYECDRENLKKILDQCFVSGELRKILAKEGIAESDPATISIKCLDNDMEVVTDYCIPTTTPEVAATSTNPGFEKEITDFLDQAESSFGLLSELPKSAPLPKGNTKTNFQWTFKGPNQERLVAAGICCNPICRSC